MGRKKIDCSDKIGKFKVGDVLTSPKYGDYEIVKILQTRSIEIRFKETNSKRVVTYRSLTNSDVKDYFQPCCEGVGFLGEMCGKTRKDGKPLKSYKVWTSMLRRCYNSKLQERHPTYKGCFVCKEWHNFTNFHKWFEENYIEGYELDKDCIYFGNKEYSPTFCKFVSLSENATMTSSLIVCKLKYEPDNTVVDVFNLKLFCEKNYLKYEPMREVCCGKRLNFKGYSKVD